MFTEEPSPLRLYYFLLNAFNKTVNVWANGIGDPNSMLNEAVCVSLPANTLVKGMNL